jgi:hypothetical protein
MTGTLPHGWTISARLMACWTFDDGSTLEVGDGDYVLTDAAGAEIMAGNDHRTPMARSWADICESLVFFLSAYSEGCDHGDGCEVPHAWCAGHAYELEELALELELEAETV